MKPLSLFIAISPRCGSYFFSDLLAQCGLPFGDEWLAPFHRDSLAWQYRRQPKLPFADYLALLSREKRQQGTFVMKCSWPQFTQLRDHFSPHNPSQFLPALASVFPNPHFVLLSRQNQLAQAISHLKARQTGIWVRRRQQATANEPTPPTCYSFLELSQQLAFTRRNQAAWQEFFHLAGIPFISILYEDLTQRPEEQMQRLFDSIARSVSLPESLKEGRFIPTRSPSSEEWKTRFADDQACTASPTTPAEAISIDHCEFSGTFIARQSTPFTVRASASSGHQPPKPFGQSDGTEWLRVCGLLENETFKATFQQELRPDPDSCQLIAHYLLPRPPSPQSYQLTLCPAQKPLSADQIRAHPRAWTRTLSFDLPPNQAQCYCLFPNLEHQPSGWVRSPWFGAFMDQRFPWIYHADHEWLFLHPARSTPHQLLAYDAHLGWITFTPESYPTFQQLHNKQSCRFLSREQKSRSFRNLETNTIFNAPTNQPRHLPGKQPEWG